MNLAQVVDTIPVVQTTAQRAGLFPTPGADQRVWNKETGTIQRFDSALGWRDEIFQNNTINWFNIKAAPFSAKGDGVNDDQPAVQSAIAAAATAGGGWVFGPAATYLLKSNLLITANGIKIIGVGAAFGQFAIPFSGTPSGGTIFKAGTGCTIMLAMSALNGAGNRALAGCGIEGVSFNCNGSALVGLALSSVCFSSFRHIYVSNATVAGLSMTGVAALNDNRTPTRNSFDMITVWNDSTNGDGIVLDGPDVAADTGGNHFGLVQVLHKNGNGVVFKNSDSNVLDYVYCNGIGTGIGVVFHGSNTAGCYSRANIIKWLSAGSVTAKGTPSYTHPSRDNVIEYLDFESNSTFPTIETGAGLVWNGNRPANVNKQATVRGDVSISITPGASTKYQYYNAPLTVNRAVTILNTTVDGGALGGGTHEGRVTRGAAATGAATLTVTAADGTSKVLAPGTWCDWLYDGSLGTSTLTAAGAL